jgi:hypothetical protein
MTSAAYQARSLCRRAIEIGECNGLPLRVHAEPSRSSMTPSGEEEFSEQ